MSIRRTKGFTLIELVVVVLAGVWIVAFLLVLLPGRRHGDSGILKESVNLRNIHVAAATYAAANKDWCPGLDSKGQYATADFVGKYYFAKNTVTNADSGAGAETDALNNYTMAVMLEEGMIAPAQMISPGETGGNTSTTELAITLATPSITGKGAAGAANGEVTRLNLSYALLQYGVPSLRNSWKTDQNQQAVVMGTRLIFTDAAATPIADKFNTVWTDAGSGQFKGSLVRGDTSTSTENFKPATLSATFGTLKYNLATTPPSAVTFIPSAHDTTTLGVFGKSGPTLGNFDASATKGQIGSAND